MTESNSSRSAKTSAAPDASIVDIDGGTRDRRATLVTEEAACHVDAARGEFEEESVSRRSTIRYRSERTALLASTPHCIMSVVGHCCVSRTRWLRIGAEHGNGGAVYRGLV